MLSAMHAVDMSHSNPHMAAMGVSSAAVVVMLPQSIVRLAKRRSRALKKQVCRNVGAIGTE
jgi:hypothetical protein